MKRISKSNRYIWIIMVTAFVLGMAVSNHYGTYYDQYIEENTCMLNISEYTNRILHTDWMTISESVEKDHGTALYYPVGVLCCLAGQTIGTSYAWHCYTFLIFFGGCIALYGIVYELFQSRRLSVISFGLLFLTPRFFAEAHYNNKDVVLLALGLGVIYFGIRYIRSRKLSAGLLFAVTAAFMTNVKIIGAWFFAVPGITFLIVNIRDRRLDFRKVLEGFGVIAVFLLTFVLITPASWGGPADFVIYCVKNASGFSRWSGTVLYAGRRQEVPLSSDYLPLQILYTTPLVLLLLSLLGHIRAAVAVVRREGNAPVYLMLFALYMVPFGYAVFKSGVVVYNGWRHFYFVYGPLVIFMGVGCEAIAQMIRRVTEKQIVSDGLFGAILVYLLFLVVIGHPYQYSYINCLAARPAQQDWQLDYWCVGGLRALDLIYDSDVRKEGYSLTVTGEGTLKADVERFSSRWNGELRYVEPDAEIPANYLVVNLTYDNLPTDGYHLIAVQQAYGNRLYEVYERD